MPAKRTMVASLSDVFLRELRGGRTSLVSVGHTGARSAVVDGECDFVTYEAGGTHVRA